MIRRGLLTAAFLLPGHTHCFSPDVRETESQMTQFLPVDRQPVICDKTPGSAMRKILVIDDEEWLREMIQLALRQNGFDVIEAPNGEQGIEVAKKELPDLILCDVNMDKVDGYLTLSALRSEPATASIPFILMTGLADQAGMRHGMELGADDYLPKPFTIEALYAAVDVRLKKVNVVRQEAEKKLADLRENISMMLPHELRTPLNGILAYGEILTSDSESLQPQEISEMGQVIYQSGKRLEHLVENFLIFAQLELLGTDPQKLQSLLRKHTQSPVALIEQQAQEQAHTLGRTEDIELSLQDVPVPMSEEYLGKIVGELVQNALKFSSAGSKVHVTLAEQDNQVVLTVSDHGRGLSTEHIARIGAYMQFDRKMHEQQGLGLGLTICKRLTELHGGTLLMQSDVGAGTVVVAKLPKAA
jgi:two-component system sensor histidine kinase/response regulator